MACASKFQSRLITCILLSLAFCCFSNRMEGQSQLPATIEECEYQAGARISCGTWSHAGDGFDVQWRPEGGGKVGSSRIVSQSWTGGRLQLSRVDDGPCKEITATYLGRVNFNRIDGDVMWNWRQSSASGIWSAAVSNAPGAKMTAPLPLPEVLYRSQHMTTGAPTVSQFFPPGTPTAAAPGYGGEINWAYSPDKKLPEVKLRDGAKMVLRGSDGTSFYLSTKEPKSRNYKVSLGVEKVCGVTFANSASSGTFAAVDRVPPNLAGGQDEQDLSNTLAQKQSSLSGATTGQGWKIIAAKYGTSSSDVDVTLRVLSLVRGGTLDFLVTDDTLQSAAFAGTPKTLRIGLQDQGGGMAEKDFAEHAHVQLPIRDRGIGEYLACPLISHAEYGWGTHKADVTSRVVNAMQGGVLNLHITPAALGAAASTHTQTLSIQYACGSTAREIVAKDGEVVVLPSANEMGEIQVLQAIWTSDTPTVISMMPVDRTSHALDATTRVASLIHDNTLILVVSNETFGGDPNPGIPKYVHLVYMHHTIRYTANIAEGRTVSLSGASESLGSPVFPQIVP
jgi:hypothetical protein